MSYFSYFRGPVWNSTPTKDISLQEFVALITEDETKEKIRLVRAGVIPKVNLDYVTFGGTFSPRRRVDELVKPSQLICLDMDKLPSVEIAYKKILSIKDQLDIRLIFISPSGNGLKIILYDKSIIDAASYTDRYLYYSDLFHQNRMLVDPSGKDISRACFISYNYLLYDRPNKGLSPIISLN